MEKETQNTYIQGSFFLNQINLLLNFVKAPVEIQAYKIVYVTGFLV